jgi:DNA repair protein RecN (Recombination protein N)
LLKRLRIQNLAVVEDVTLEFGSGLNALTGSTGAGKSLILGAVNLLLGGKASIDAIRAGEKTATVEGVFESPHAPGVVGNSVTIRREVHRNGRSRAFVDRSSVPAKQLQEISSRWIEPHGQNEQLRLRDPDAHVSFVDAFAGNQKPIAAYQDALGSFRNAERTLAEFDRKVATLKEKEELLRHRIEEIDRAAMTEGEMDELESKIRLLENAEKIFEALGFVHEALDDDEAGAGSAVAQSIRRLSGLAKVDERIGAFGAQLEQVEISLRDCADGVRAYLDGFEFDPEYLRSMHDRRSYLLELERRYGVSVDEIVRTREVWADDLESVAFEDEERRALSERVEETAQVLKSAANDLSAARRTAAGELDRRMTSELKALMIAGARFRTEITSAFDKGDTMGIADMSSAARADGADAVRFMVVTNPGEAEGPVDEIASTGETSRISLALRSTIEGDRSGGAAHRTARGETRSRLSRPGGGSVLVFDEVDAGVGADLGGVIADKLLELCKRYQIICITHMPQIAAAANRHLVVVKQSADGRTAARVTPAEGDDRRREIARMLGGESGSDKRLALAGELLVEGRGGGKQSQNKRP